MGQILAALSGYNQDTVASKVEVAGDKVNVARENDGGLLPKEDRLRSNSYTNKRANRLTGIAHRHPSERAASRNQDQGNLLAPGDGFITCYCGDLRMRPGSVSDSHRPQPALHILLTSSATCQDSAQGLPMIVSTVFQDNIQSIAAKLGDDISPTLHSVADATRRLGRTALAVGAGMNTADGEFP